MNCFCWQPAGEKFYALVDADDGRAEKKYTIAEGLNMPNGVAFYKGSLIIYEGAVKK
jgi:hypothetical protein